MLSGRRWRKVVCKLVFRPEFTFHVVIDEAYRHREIYVSDRHSEGHMDVQITKRGAYIMKVRRAFIDHIMGGVILPDFVVKKASDMSIA